MASLKDKFKTGMELTESNLGDLIDAVESNVDQETLDTISQSLEQKISNVQQSMFSGIDSLNNTIQDIRDESIDPMQLNITELSNKVNQAVPKIDIIESNYTSLQTIIQDLEERVNKLENPTT